MSSICILYYLNHITEKDHPKRDPKVLEPYLTLAEDYFSNPDAYDQAEKKRRSADIKKIGTNFSCIPLYNAFIKAPMGHVSNHIGKSPVDVLHTIWGGLMKNMCGYVLTILNQIGKHSGEARFSNILETFDKRISSFPKVFEKIPHVQWTYFPDGLVSKLLEGITKSDGRGNTGAGGGFRSAHFVPVLLQIYFAVQNLLPVQQVVLTKTVYVENVNSENKTRTRETMSTTLHHIEEIVLGAVESLLHLHFELCRDHWNDRLRQNLKNLVSVVKRKYVSLWKTKEQTYFREPLHLPGWKVHDIEHFPDHICEFGPVWSWETGPFEMFNKVTKDIWQKTSGRKASECSELIKQDLLRTLVSYHADKEAVLSGKYFSEKLISLDEPPNVTEFRNISKSKKSYCSIYSRENGFQVVGDISSDEFSKFLIPFEVFNTEMNRFFEDLNIFSFGDIQLSKRDLVTIVGSKESSLGTIILHAYSKIGSVTDQSTTNIKMKSWYDFVLIQGLGGKHLLAQVMGIFEIFDKVNNLSQFCFFVKYLESIEYKEHTGSGQNRSDFVSSDKLYSEYRWAARVGSRSKYDVGVVSQDCIADVAFVVPSFSNNPSLQQNSNHSSDRFYFIHRKMFDRSGWTITTPSMQSQKSESVSASASSGVSSRRSMAENQIQAEASLRLSVKGRHSEKDLDRLFEYFDEQESQQDPSTDVFADSLLTFE